jgi:hypothetical protein
MMFLPFPHIPTSSQVQSNAIQSLSHFKSTSDIPDTRRLVDFQLLLPFSQQEFDRSKVFLVQGYVASEFPPRKGLEVGPVCCGLEAGGAEAAAVEGEDVALEAG